MADNATVDNGALADIECATDKVTYSGDADRDVQLQRPVHVAGSEGSKTVEAVTGTLGSALPAAGLVLGGSDGTNLRALKLDAAGEAQVDVLTLPALVAGTAYVGKVRITDGTNDLTVDTAHGDAESTTENHLDVAAKIMGFNGTDWDRLRSDTTYGLAVAPRSNVIRISLTPTISTGIYASGDSLGSLLTFANAARISGGSGTLLGITVIDKTQAQRAAIDFLFFDRTLTVAADNAAVATSDADMANCLGLVTAGPYNTAWAGTPLNSISTLFNIGMPFVLNGTDLFAVAIVRATPTYTATSDLIFNLTILRD